MTLVTLISTALVATLTVSATVNESDNAGVPVQVIIQISESDCPHEAKPKVKPFASPEILKRLERLKDDVIDEDTGICGAFSGPLSDDAGCRFEFLA